MEGDAVIILQSQKVKKVLTKTKQHTEHLALKKLPYITFIEEGQ